MNLLLLTKDLSLFHSILDSNGNTIISTMDEIDLGFLKENRIDFAISYGYRYIVREPILKYLENRIINLHISYLPWNRGADPNLWSFLEDTPKGVSIHHMNTAIDRGDLITQKEIRFDPDRETLRTTYRRLEEEMIELFRSSWADIARGSAGRKKQVPGGSYHRGTDKERFLHLLTHGWDTPVRALTGKGLS